MPGKELQIEIRNKDFGPVENGPFMQAQITGVKSTGIGDGMFHSFYKADNGSPGGQQYGYEGLITPVIKILYKDNSVQEIKLQNSLPMPGQACSLTVELKKNKNLFDIQILNLALETVVFAHSRSGGGGMSTTGNVELGAIAIQGTNISQWKKTYVSVALSEQWTRPANMDKNSEDYIELNPKDFLELKQITKMKKVNDTHWKDVQLIPGVEWRSALDKYWDRNPRISQKYNLHNNHIFIFPICVFEPEQPGFVIGINDGSRRTESMKKHMAAFLEYDATNEDYQKEYEAYQKWFFQATIDARSEDDSNSALPVNTLGAST